MRFATLKISYVLALMLVLSATYADSKISDLNWLSGHWCWQNGTQKIEEYWLPSSDDMMIGLGRTLKDNKTRSFEYFRIAVHDGVVSYLAQPEGQAETVFKRVDRDAQWVRFENLSHDFPTRVEYKRSGDKLLAVIAGPGKDGTEKVIPFDYSRCEP